MEGLAAVQLTQMCTTSIDASSSPNDVVVVVVAVAGSGDIRTSRKPMMWPLPVDDAANTWDTKRRWNCLPVVHRVTHYDHRDGVGNDFGWPRTSRNASAAAKRTFRVAVALPSLFALSRVWL